MKLTLKTLRSLIRETLYRASAPKRLNLPDVEVKANSTREAGEKASQEFFKQHKQRVDPMTVSLTPKYGTDHTDTVNMNINSRLDDFIAEADKVNGALATLGHDDDSYEAGDLRDEAIALKDILKSGDPSALEHFFDDSMIYDVTDVDDWLDKAEKRLDRLG